MEKLKSVLEKYVNASAPLQASPIPDYRRTVNYDEEGNEVITYPAVSGSDIVKANGSFLNWSLNSLLSAGINPNFAIHTGIGTRLDGYASILDAVASLDNALQDAPASE